MDGPWGTGRIASPVRMPGRITGPDHRAGSPGRITGPDQCLRESRLRAILV